MAWWPFSSSGTDAAAEQTKPISTAASVLKRSNAPTPEQPPSSAQHDADFYNAHPHLAPPDSNAVSSPASQAASAGATTTEEFDPTLPRTMSCRDAFDSAFYCASLGGHFNDIYRYGQLRSCSEHWSDFWFCMRTKNSYSGQDVKERMIQDRYREKELTLKSGPNSEHVWRKRGPGEEIKGAFSKPEE
ncbi:hypothetical protein GMOD_00004636 [Pyrenophora seminiperda CCB06]|uniref:Uncharacterized protein n=1 Tax=Pyrenophora seminiperda CCB06 TaxID=1302712 RepID=A0A3M7MHL3_9PLEO|nr:hypothetical protein GMOD_00004636 [Pyrenophora seminiperda CCB06]